MQRRLSISLVIMLFLSVVIFFAREAPSFVFIQSIIQKLIREPLSALYSLQPGSSGDEKTEIFRLKDQNQKLIETLADFEKIKKDNVALRSQFEQKDQNTQKLLPARIIGITGKSLTPDSFIIDRGTSDGVQKGQAVVSGKNLIGKIEKVGATFSKIALLANSAFSTVGKTVDSQSQGVVMGEGDFIIFTNISIKDTLKKDDIVTTVGDVNEKGVGVPPDYIIGKISDVNKSESKPTQESKIRTLINFSKLRIVFIMLP